LTGVLKFEPIIFDDVEQIKKRQADILTQTAIALDRGLIGEDELKSFIESQIKR
jgi:hypothetical protein